MADYYDVLGVSRDSDEKTIRQSYRKLARQFHPDLNPGEETKMPPQSSRKSMRRTKYFPTRKHARSTTSTVTNGNTLTSSKSGPPPDRLSEDTRQATVGPEGIATTYSAM